MSAQKKKQSKSDFYQDHFSLCSILRWQAKNRPQALAFLEMNSSGIDKNRQTYATFYAAVEMKAAALKAKFLPGSRVLITVPNGMEFATAFFACLEAGLVAVPIHGPPGGTDFHEWKRLTSAFKHCSASGVLSTEKARVGWQACPESVLTEGLIFLETLGDEVATAQLDQLPTELRPNDRACLLYTSGSTGQPKAVSYTHQNLYGLCRRACQRSQYAEDSIILNWQTASHISGLIAGYCIPVFAGASGLDLPLATFTSQPTIWLQVISRYKVTHASGPSFAYEICAKQITNEIKNNLNLSNWKNAVIAADNVRYQVLQNFADTFKSVGFNPSSFQPCYGQTEGFRVAAAPVSAEMKVCLLEREALSQGKALISKQLENSQDNAMAVVGHGPLTGEDVKIVIVDPQKRIVCANHEVGEIWVHGQGLASEYYQNPTLSEETFSAKLASRDSEAYLRTGDLGFTDGEDLYIVGRLKDLIIIRGRNLHPIDIESTVLQSDSKVAKDAVAAISIDRNGEELLIVCIELKETNLSPSQLETLSQEMRRLISSHHGCFAEDIVFVPSKTLPRTISGKVSRSSCREAYLKKSLPRLNGETATKPDRQFVAPQNPQQTLLLKVWQSILNLPQIGIYDDFFNLGGDSLLSMQLISRLRTVGISMTLAQLQKYSTIAQLDEFLSQGPAINTKRTANFVGEVGLLPSQTRVLKAFDRFKEQNKDGDLSYLSLPKFFRFSQPIDLNSLELALAAVVEHHSALRSSFEKRQEQWVQTIHAKPVSPILNVKKFALPMAQAQDQMMAWFVSRMRGWDLAQPGLLRVSVAMAEDGALLMMVSNHLISDYLTESMLVEEILTAYHQLAAGQKIRLPLSSSSVKDIVDVLQEIAAQGMDAEEKSYWENTLSNHVAPPKSNLSQDAPRARAHLMKVIGPTDMLKATQAATKHQCSVSDLVLAAFSNVITHWTGQDTRIEIAHHGRNLPDSQLDLVRTAGLMFYDVPIVAKSNSKATAAELVGDTKNTLRQIPRSGIGFALKRMQDNDPMWQTPAHFGFNYIRVSVLSQAALFPLMTPVPELTIKALHGGSRNEFADFYYGNQVRCVVFDLGVQIICSVEYPTHMASQSEIHRLLEDFENQLKLLN